MGSNTIITASDRSRDSQEDAPVFKYKLNDDADQSEVEDLYNYGPGGYHPVALGDVLGDGGRFRVVHKLGYGGYATIWLCHDSASKKWRAVKIMAAAASQPYCADLTALELFDGIDPEVLAANHIQLALEHFWIDGPNGRHLCFVLPFLGPKLSSVYYVYGHLPELMKDICFQLVEAVKFIHSHDLCHGDFRTDNILFRLADGVDEWNEDAIMKLLGKPDLVQVVRVDDDTAGSTEFEPGVPAYLVERTHMAYGSGACSSEIAVIDFGVSYHISQPPRGKGTGIPLPYAAPENLFSLDSDLGFHTDIWALGVTIAKVRCGFTPFADDDIADTMLEGVEKMECIMGPMPEPYRTVWKNWNGVFLNCQDDNGETREDDSWKDEAVFATLDTEEQEWTEKNRISEGCSPNYLHYRTQGGLIMHIDEDQAADMAAQAAANTTPRRLPTYKWGEESRRLTFEEQVQYTMTASETSQLFDLFLRMFKWHPKKRETLDQIASHEWFGDRNDRQRATVPSPPKHTRSKRTRSPSSPSPLQPAKKPKNNDNGAAKEGVADSKHVVTNACWSRSLYQSRAVLGLRRGAGWVRRGLSWLMEKIKSAVSHPSEAGAILPW